MKKAGIRTEIDDRNEKIGKKIRDTELHKVPYMLVVGEKDMNDKVVSVRRHGKGDEGAIAVADFVSKIKKEIAERQDN